MKTILSKGDTNAKTKKNKRPTSILYMTPSYVENNGKTKDMCPYASDACREACLYTAGRGAMPNVQEARQARTFMYLNDKQNFFTRISNEINETAKRTQGEYAIRLNGTSDQPLVEHLVKEHRILPNVTFYDYTKNPKKAKERILSSGHRYVVAYSKSEKCSSLAETMQVLDNGGIVAVVFRNEIPTTYLGYPVYDGDERDDLMLDIQGPAVLGLKAKGKAKKDASGFVVN